jgi:ankyrin repeat protein
MKALYRAAEHNDAQQIHALLDTLTDAKKRQTLAGSALATAAWFGSTEAAIALLDCGANVERKDSGGETALIIAARQGRLQTVQLLVVRGAKIDARARAGWTALMIACVFGQKEVVRFLLSQGATPHPTPQHRGESALHMALRSRAVGSERQEIVRMLLEQGVDVNVGCATTPPLLQAALSADRPIIEMLLARGADKAARDTEGNDILYWAARNPDPEVLAILREAVTSPPAPSSNRDD